MTGRIETMRFKKLLSIILDDAKNTLKAREMAKQEIERREKVFRESVEDALLEIELGRLGYPTAMVDMNAPLALIQCGLENQRRALVYALVALDRKDGEG